MHIESKYSRRPKRPLPSSRQSRKAAVDGHFRPAAAAVCLAICLMTAPMLIAAEPAPLVFATDTAGYGMGGEMHDAEAARYLDQDDANPSPSDAEQRTLSALAAAMRRRPFVRRSPAAIVRVTPGSVPERRAESSLGFVEDQTAIPARWAEAEVWRPPSNVELSRGATDEQARQSQTKVIRTSGWASSATVVIRESPTRQNPLRRPEQTITARASTWIGTTGGNPLRSEATAR